MFGDLKKTISKHAVSIFLIVFFEEIELKLPLSKEEILIVGI